MPWKARDGRLMLINGIQGTQILPHLPILNHIHLSLSSHLKNFISIYMARDEGLEPPTTDLESVVFPVTPIPLSLLVLHST